MIARVRHRIGGKIGGISRFFQTETTVLEPSQNVLWRSGQSLGVVGQAVYLIISAADLLGRPHQEPSCLQPQQ